MRFRRSLAETKEGRCGRLDRAIVIDLINARRKLNK